MRDPTQSFAPGVIRASFARSAKAYDRAAQRGEPIAVPFGRYLLLDRIKRGGMAEVYRAKVVGHEGFEKIVAIKRILPHLAANEDFVTMFIDEAKIVSYLNHQNICPVIELGRCEDGLYIVMEYIWGRDLRQVLNAMARTGRLMPVNVAAYIAARIAEGLDYAHRRVGPMGKPLDIVHRDVSPQNVLVSFDGEVKVIDFGIASASQRSTETRAGTFKGKFAYMSPEQARGQSLDRRSDVFAAAILLHEMLTGSRLFAGKTDLETLDRVRNCEVPPPARPFEAVPEELVRIALRGLAKDVEDRYQSAGELHEDLDRFLINSGQLTSASRLGTWICINFSEEAAKALVDQERAARAHPAGAPPPPDEESSAVAQFGVETDRRSRTNVPAPTGSRHEHESVSVSSSIADSVSSSVSEVVDDMHPEVDDNGFGLAVEVDDDAFGLDEPEAAPRERPVLPARPPPPASQSAVHAFGDPRATESGFPARPLPARPPPPSSPPHGSAHRDSSVNVPAVGADNPRVHDSPNPKRRRRAEPLEVEYSPWTRFAQPTGDTPLVEPSRPPAPDDPGVRVSASLDPMEFEETVILDEPPPGCTDEEHEPDPDGAV